MTIKEMSQTILGNVLLCFVMRAFILMVKRQRFAMVEHLTETQSPSEQWLGSIWRLFLTRVLLHHESVTKAEIFQGWFGAKAPKPTTLLFTAGPRIDVAGILRKMQTTDVLPKGLSMGYDSEAKEYSTASLKNYPGGLCAAIKTIAQEWLDLYLPSTISVSTPPSFHEFVQYSEKLVQGFNFAAARGADFHH